MSRALKQHDELMGPSAYTLQVLRKWKCLQTTSTCFRDLSAQCKQSFDEAALEIKLVTENSSFSILKVSYE
jgi:hypothetical protein